MTTLLVSSDRVLGDRIARALEALGHDVMWCRGPSGPDCVCPAIRGASCPLTPGVGAVVLDTLLTNDQLGHGFRATQLVEYYEGLGLPLVALIADPASTDTPRFDRRTVVLPRRSEPTEIAAAARGATALWISHRDLERPA